MTEFTSNRMLVHLAGTTTSEREMGEVSLVPGVRDERDGGEGIP